MRQLSQSLRENLRLLGTAPMGGFEFSTRLDDVLHELEQLPAYAVVWAERQIAAAGSMYGSLQRPARLLGLIDREPPQHRALRESPLLALIWIFHRNGYVREMALQVISEPPRSAFFLAAVFSRLNDWAEPVRKAAELCLNRILPQIESNVVIDASPFLLGRFNDWKRWTPDGLALLDSLMTRPDVIAAFREKFWLVAKGPLGAQMRSLLRNDAMDKHLAALAAYSRNPAIRSVCLKTLVAGQAEIATGFETKWTDKVYGLGKQVRKFDYRKINVRYDVIECINRGLADRSVAIRRVAGDAVIERRADFPNLNAVTETMLRDKNYSIRERGDFLRRHPQT